MGKYINRGCDGFARYANGEYVDKTGLIAYVNSTICTDRMLTCATRPRRFGKSAAAQMLYAYYDKSCDASHIFDTLQIASDSSYRVHLNRYPTIFIDTTDFITKYHGRMDIVEKMQDKVMDDIRKVYPDIDGDEDDDLMDLLLAISQETGEKFVIIIDEWDALCREAADRPQLMEGYVNFLRRLFKSGNTEKVFAAAYMTGILPIKKYGTQSTLNDFKEFSMTNPGQLAPFFGFTPDEVRALCRKFGMDYDLMRGWYDGYDFKQPEVSVFNPNSVMEACFRHVCDNYWAKTEAFESLQRYIDMDFDGIQDSIAELLDGRPHQTSVLRFGNELNAVGSTDELFTLFIHLGYLSYDLETRTVKIPNLEIRMEFVEALRGSKTHSELASLIKASDSLLKSTLAGDAQKVAAIIEYMHNHQTAPDFYNNEQALRSVIKLAYISTVDSYIYVEELPSGRGYADVVYIPRPKSNVPALVVELKWNKTSSAAIEQIKRKEYPDLLQRLTGDVMLVGINYDADTKSHTCRIESY